MLSYERQMKIHCVKVCCHRDSRVSCLQDRRASHYSMTAYTAQHIVHLEAFIVTYKYIFVSVVTDVHKSTEHFIVSAVGEGRTHLTDLSAIKQP